MSDWKFLVFNGSVVNKVDELIEKLESDIEEEKSKPEYDKREENKVFPWECLLEQLKHISVIHKRDYVDVDYSLYLEMTGHNDDNYPSKLEFMKLNYPELGSIFDETPIEKHRKDVYEIRKEWKDKRTYEPIFMGD